MYKWMDENKLKCGNIHLPTFRKSWSKTNKRDCFSVCRFLVTRVDAQQPSETFLHRNKLIIAYIGLSFYIIKNDNNVSI